MFSFIFKTLILQKRPIHLETNLVRFLQTLPVTNTTSSKPTDQQPLTVSYLTNSCGLSLEKAISASKEFKIENTEKPDSVLRLLASHGCNKSHIARLISKNPRIVLADPEKNLKPKIEYFQSLGVSGSDLPALLSSARSVLATSLKNQIMPFIDFLKGFLQTDDNLTRALLKVSLVIGRNFEKIIVPNINTLRAYGVPEPHIVKLFLLAPRSFLLRFDLFEKRVDAIEKMGFEPTSKSFTLAVRSMATISKSNWEKKKEILINLGWSEDEFYFAFKRQPLFVLTSGKKIEILMDFFVEKLGLKPSYIVRRPNLLLFSLEGRIIPRWSVIKVLKSKKLLEKDVDVGLYLAVNSKQFEKKFVIPYMDKTPEVMRAYQGGA
ncbi:hypothetical protein Q3G72_003469 [Acer saccharum]|nr:hypothetical protein Q3G72_003469 [Acer saccharum]